MRVPIAPASVVRPDLPAYVDVPSSSGPGTYRVRRMPDNSLVCPCRGFEYREDCKHVRQVLAEYGE